MFLKSIIENGNLSPALILIAFRASVPGHPWIFRGSKTTGLNAASPSKVTIIFSLMKFARTFDNLSGTGLFLPTFPIFNFSHSSPASLIKAAIEALVNL